MTTGVALIATLLNEEAALPEFLASVRVQSRQADEVVLVDGGSTDRSCEIIEGYIESGMPIRLIVEQGANRSRGRNIGVQQTEMPIIAVSDVGCRLAPDWLETIVAPLERGEAEVASGYYVPQAETVLERAVAAATVPTVREVNPKTFLPSSRSVAFLREAWEGAGGYPEWTAEAEDTLFDMHLKQSDARFVFVPEAIVFWQQHGRMTQVFRQFFRYAQSDGKLGLPAGHYRKTFFLSGWLIGLFVLLLGSAVIAPYVAGWFLLLIVLTMAGYYLRYLLRSRRRGWDWGAAALSPVVMLVVDAANYAGYRFGTYKRGRR